MGAERPNIPVLEIFQAAADMADADQRAAYLQHACAGDTALKSEIEQLLEHDRAEDSLLDRATPGLSATLDVALLEQPGTRIGPYKPLEQIGEGGMGIVFVAEQRKPISRKVALKIIKPGMDTRAVVARFEAERQALALMDHPNIAKVFDAGATEAGRPYFVMELVKGKPITEYCDREQLSTRERLELFVTLCHGVQHAHQKGVIHRDLKPSNVLVEVHDVRPVPKIIDFGVAKAMGQHLTDPTLHTDFEQMVGTPLYMSPEQAGLSSVDVDTRSDIYSLGVLLYELLTGHTPFEKDTLRMAGADELRRIIREVDPPRPSARVSTLAAAELSTISDRRHIEPRKLSQQLRGDLDWIVMKALDKDRARRYESASALAADVQRYLADEPVQARPPSLAHHTAKWVRRHRPLVWSTSVVLILATVTGATLMWTNYRRAAQVERDVGEHLAAATAFFRSADYQNADRKLAEARWRLDAARNGTGPMEEQVTALTAEIAAKTRAMDDFAKFQNLRQRIHSEMYALDRDILDQAQADCRTALELFGVLQADRFESQPAYQNLNAERQAMLDEGAVELLFILARLEMDKSAAVAAVESTSGYLEAIQVLRKIESIHPHVPAVSLWSADCFEAIGEQRASAEARTQAESLRPSLAIDYFLFGEYEARHGRHAQALASYWQALAQQPDHYLALLSAGVALGELNEHQSAEAMLTGAIALNPQTVIAYLKRATARTAQGKVVLAQADVEEARRRDPELARALLRRATEYRANYQFNNALADFGEAIRLDPTAAAYRGRTDVFILQGDLDQALADCNECLKREPASASAYCTRAEIYRLKNEWDKASADADEAIRLDPKCANAFLVRGRIRAHRNQLNEAVVDLNEAIKLEPKEAGYRSGRGEIYLQLGDREKALADYQAAVEIDPKHVWGHMGLAICYRDTGHLDQALAAADEAVRVAPEYLGAYLERAAVYRAKGNFEQALTDYDEAVRVAPQFADVYWLRADFCKDRRDFDRALADCQEAIRLAPKHMRAHECLVSCYREKGELDNALAAADEAVRMAPESSLAYTWRAAVHEAKKDYEKALADSNEAIRLAPNSASAYVARANTHRAMRQLDKGLADMDEAIRLGSDFPAGEYGHRGHFHRDRGDFDKALADYSEAIRLSPRFLVAYLVRAELYANKGEFDKAAADYDRAVELAQSAPLSWHHYKRRALAHFRLNHYDKALESITTAVELNPRDGSSLLWLPPEEVVKCPDERLRNGVLKLADTFLEKTEGSAAAYSVRSALYLAFGRPDEARADFDKATQLDLPNWCWWQCQASAYAEYGRWDEAIAALSRIVEEKPEGAKCWYQLALARLGAGQIEAYRQDCAEMLRQFSQANNVQDINSVGWSCGLAPGAVTDWSTIISLVEQAAQSDPTSAESLAILGAVLYRAERFDDAIARLTEADAMVTEPTEASVLSPAYTWFFLAMTHQRLGHAEDARQWLDKALAWTDRLFAEADQGAPVLPWNVCLTRKLLRDEAESLLNLTPPAVNSAPKEEAKIE